MTVLLRQLLSLQDAGVDEVRVEGVLPGRLPADPRLRVRVTAVAPGLPAGFRARQGLVWHRLLPQRLVKGGYTGDLEAVTLQPNEFIVAVSDEASRRRADRLLYQSLLKATDGFVSRYLNRPVSLWVTRRVIETNLSPNQMTLLAAMVGLGGIGVVLAWGTAGLIPGALLVQLQSILDGCDGEISRLKYIRSRTGEWLDQVLDDVVNLGFFCAVGWVLYLAGSTTALALTVTGAALHLVYQLALYSALVLRGGGSGSIASIRWRGQRDPVPSIPGARRNPFHLFKEAVETAGRRDFFTLLYLPASVLGYAEIALGWCAVIFAVSGVTTGLQWLLYGGPEAAPRG
jgi:phosphatidylglycerophosphate synthase